MTAATQIVQTQQPQRSIASSPAVSALAVEILKSLKLVAPATMTGDAQLAWVACAVEALEGISAQEVSAISTELRRTVTRPAQIVPEIARLVADARRRRFQASEPSSPSTAAEARISREAAERRGKAKCRNDVEEAWAWERRERINAGLPVEPLAPPLTREELNALPSDTISMGIEGGFLEYRNGTLFEPHPTTGAH